MSKSESRPLRIVVVGHVDHGKSTLIGRLLHDTGSISNSKLAEIQSVCERRGVPFDWAFLLDAMQAERDQNITIDTCQIWLKSPVRPYVIIDAPGHLEFLKNMITGAASAHAAVLLISAKDGVKEQSRRHAFLLNMLGIRELVVLVNKMDLVGYQSDVFESIQAECRDFLDQIGLRPRAVIPISARDGSNLATHSVHLDWYDGPTVLQALDAFELPANTDHEPLRFPVQDVYQVGQKKIIAGRIESGTLRVGDRLRFAPSLKQAVVQTIERWQDKRDQDPARTGESIGITLDETIGVERGQIGFDESAPPAITTKIRASVLWMGPQEMDLGVAYRLKLATQDVECKVVKIYRVIDAGTLSVRTAELHRLLPNEVAEVDIETLAPIAADCVKDCPTTARFVLVDQYDVAGGGIIIST